jgi:hypothetical protein
MNDKGGVLIINTKGFHSQMNVGLKKAESNQGTRFTHKPNRWWLSLRLPELITLDPNVRFGKTIPRWKGNWTRNKNGYASMSRFYHDVPKN